MKLLLAHFALFLALFAVAVAVEVPGDPAPAEMTPPPSEPLWRRTADGWERMSDWGPPPPPEHQPWGNVTAIHPLTIGTFQLLASLGALLAFSPLLLPSTETHVPRGLKTA